MNIQEAIEALNEAAHFMCEQTADESAITALEVLLKELKERSRGRS